MRVRRKTQGSTRTSPAHQTIRVPRNKGLREPAVGAFSTSRGAPTLHISASHEGYQLRRGPAQPVKVGHARGRSAVGWRGGRGHVRPWRQKIAGLLKIAIGPMQGDGDRKSTRLN